MTISPRSMAAWWMSGFEDRPERCGEICVFEVFGDAVEPGRSAAVGMGLKPFRDPRVADDFAAPRLPLDVAGFHEYAVRWTPQEAAFSVDGDATNNVDSYTLDDNAGGLFQIDPATGIVATAALINRESPLIGSYNITVRATSQDLSTTTTTYTIVINDIDEEVARCVAAPVR